MNMMSSGGAESFARNLCKKIWDWTKLRKSPISRKLVFVERRTKKSLDQKIKRWWLVALLAPPIFADTLLRCRGLLLLDGAPPGGFPLRRGRFRSAPEPRSTTVTLGLGRGISTSASVPGGGALLFARLSCGVGSLAQLSHVCFQQWDKKKKVLLTFCTKNRQMFSRKQTVTTRFESSVAQPQERYMSTSLRMKSDTDEPKSDDTVCSIDYDALDTAFTRQFDLLELPSGGFRYVSPTNGGVHFDVSYYHHELQQVVFLGRFTDPRTASLAHAIARKNPDLRAVDGAAQAYIESKLPATPSKDDDDDGLSLLTAAIDHRSTKDPTTTSAAPRSPIPALHAINLFGS